jgi:hypothetical protein
MGCAGLAGELKGCVSNGCVVYCISGDIILGKIIPELSLEVKYQERLTIGKRAFELLGKGVLMKNIKVRLNVSDAHVRKSMRDYEKFLKEGINYK